ncbi:C-type lectin domain protein [Candidatus Magnetomorum sp. HK-1]|nr:C-type lectin domain protein [Candidatus Magnetomorum sp. HK-1]
MFSISQKKIFSNVYLIMTFLIFFYCLVGCDTDYSQQKIQQYVIATDIDERIILKANLLHKNYFRNQFQNNITISSIFMNENGILFRIEPSIKFSHSVTIDIILNSDEVSNFSNSEDGKVDEITIYHFNEDIELDIPLVKNFNVSNPIISFETSEFSTFWVISNPHDIKGNWITANSTLCNDLQEYIKNLDKLTNLEKPSEEGCRLMNDFWENVQQFLNFMLDFTSSKLLKIWLSDEKTEVTITIDNKKFNGCSNPNYSQGKCQGEIINQSEYWKKIAQERSNQEYEKLKESCLVTNGKINQDPTTNHMSSEKGINLYTLITEGDYSLNGDKIIYNIIISSEDKMDFNTGDSTPFSRFGCSIEIKDDWALWLQRECKKDTHRYEDFVFKSEIIESYSFTKQVPDSCIDTDTDTDGDGIPDNDDPFPKDPAEWEDTDCDGKGNNADEDDDNDDVNDKDDTFPKDPKEWKDTDCDGKGDNADEDDDNDDVHDKDDSFPKDPKKWNDTDDDGKDTDGDGKLDNADEDDDNDGFHDKDDVFPKDPKEWEDTDCDGKGDNAEEDEKDDGKGGSVGDPHFFTIDGLYYDNQLIGEFILCREIGGTGFELQVRQQRISGWSQCVTFNTAISMRLGSNVVEYRAQTNEILIDGVLSELKEGDIRNISGGVQVIRTKGILCTDSFGTYVNIKDFGSYLNIRINISNLLFRKMEGLLGNFDRNVQNEIQMRNGNKAPNRSEFMVDWRLTDSESLFTYNPGENSDTYKKNQVCGVSISYNDIEAAKQLCLEQFKNECDDAMLAAIATDIAAGMTAEEVSEWVSDMKNSVKSLNTIGALPIKVMVYEGNNYPNVDSIPVRTTSINNIKYYNNSQMQSAFGCKLGFALDIRSALRIPVSGTYLMGIVSDDGFYIGFKELGSPEGPVVLNTSNGNLSGVPNETVTDGYPIATGWMGDRGASQTTMLVDFSSPGDYNFELVYRANSLRYSVLYFEVQGPVGSGINEDGLAIAPAEFFTHRSDKNFDCPNNIALSKLGATATDNGHFTGQFSKLAIDDDDSTYWAGIQSNSPQQMWITFDKSYLIDRILINERSDAYMRSGAIQYNNGNQLLSLLNIVKDSPGFFQTFNAVQATGIRITINSLTAPSSWYNEVACIYTVKVNSVSPTNEAELCEGWKYYSLNNHYYKAISCPNNFFECSNLANKEGAHLVTINNEKENNWIIKSFEKKYYWIGLTDEAEEGNWQWITGEPVNFTNWYCHSNFCEPNNNGPGPENYAFINYIKNGKWNDVSNGDSRYPFNAIIEKNICNQ